MSKKIFKSKPFIILNGGDEEK
jgi:hypothetical protein